jgi:uncharacterized membrane protein YkvA (DUF1232 family)
MTDLFARIKAAAKALKLQLDALAGAARDPRTPWYARLLAVAIVAYALSPIDLIPDFVPVLGYLDDLILVPAGLWFALRLIPAEVMEEHRQRVRDTGWPPPSKAAAAVIVGIWLAAIAWVLSLPAG